MSRSLLRLMVTTTVVLLLAALAGKLVVYGDVQAPSRLPTLKGGFTPMGATLDAVSSGVTRPALAVVERRPISPTLGITYRRFISPTVWLAYPNRRFISPTLALESPERRIISPTVMVAQFNPATRAWEAQGGPLYVDEVDPTLEPTLDFGGPDRQVPWVAFTEQRIAQHGVKQVFAAYYADQQWRIHPTPLNADPSRNASQPALAAGALKTTDTPLPWAAWSEETGRGQAIIARRFISPTAASGAVLTWDRVGQPLNLGQRLARQPDLVFSGPDNSAPWLVWQEEGGGQPTRVYAARGVADAGSPGGYRWQVVGPRANCGGDPAACALVVTPDTATLTPRVASGTLPGETVPTPWLVFVEQGANGRGEVRVMSLKQGVLADPDDDLFAAVGGSVNTACLARRKLTAQNGSLPDIAVVGNVPHVTWTEQQGRDSRVYVCHLLDARESNQIWDMDTDAPGVRQSSGGTARLPAIVSEGTTPFVTWLESASTTEVNPTEPAETLAVAYRSPLGPAWGTAYPPLVRCPGGTTDGICREAKQDQTVVQAPWTFVGDDIVVTTSCDHVNGWRAVQRIEFARYDRQTESRVFYGLYVADTDPAQGKVYIEDPAHPGQCQPGQVGSICRGGVTIGTDLSIELDRLTLGMKAMRAVPHGPVSPALDVDWAFRFKQTGDYVEAINIVYRDPGDTQLTPTDLFQVGDFSVVNVTARLFLPLVNQAAPHPTRP